MVGSGEERRVDPYWNILTDAMPVLKWPCSSCPAVLGNLAMLTRVELFRAQLIRVLLMCLQSMLMRVLGLLLLSRRSLVVMHE